MFRLSRTNSRDGLQQPVNVGTSGGVHEVRYPGTSFEKAL
jgi:hypothetical protein